MPRPTAPRHLPRPHALAAAALALLLAGCGAPPDPETGRSGDLRMGSVRFTPCSLSAGQAESVEAQCATLAVPENPAAPDGRKIKLALALIPASGQAEPDPLVFIAGGPGQSILQAYPMLHAQVRDARRSRNVLLVDARGTGRSHLLQCKEALSLMDGGEDSDDDTGATQTAADAAPDEAQMRAAAAACRDRLGKDSDLRFYGTAEHIRDLDLVRQTLGIEQLNLIGISYGTRVAQQYAARYPKHTRTVVLDSTVPNTLVLGQDHAANLDAAISRMFARCNADAACKKQLGDPAQNLATVRARLQAGNLAPVRYRDPQTGQWREERPGFGHLAGLLRMYAYSPEASAMLPLVLHEAAEGHYEPLLAQARGIGGKMTDAIALGMHLSVSCTEDPELRVREEDAGTVMGQELSRMLIAMCAEWPKGTRDPDFRKPLTGPLPMLILSGEDDPVTPPRYGDEIAKTLPNARHLVLPGQGHSVLGIGCAPKLLAQFLETADAKSLDASCLKRLRPRAPFAGDYGWEP